MPLINPNNDPSRAQKGYLTCIMVSCFVDITYKLLTIILNSHPFAQSVLKFKSKNCSAHNTLDLYLFSLLKIYSICVMFWGISSCRTKNLYSFNIFRCLFYIYLLVQILFLFFIVFKTVVSNCAPLKFKAKVAIGLLMLLVGIAILAIYTGVWLYFLNRANDFLQRDGNKEYNDELDSNSSAVEFRLTNGSEGDADEKQRLKARAKQYPNYGTNQDALNPKGTDGKPILANVADFSNLQDSNNMML